LLSHSLLLNKDAWQPLVERFGDRFRFILYDMRGHGASTAPPLPWTMADLAEDVIDLLDATDTPKAHFVGLSIGGRIGQWLAVHHPARIGRLVLACTSGRVAPEAVAGFAERVAIAKAKGIPALITPTIERWYGASLAEYPIAQLDAVASMIGGTSPEGFEGCVGALTGPDVFDRLGEVTAPTLVVSGAHDASNPPTDGLKLVERIPDSRMVVIEGAGHQACLQRPDEFATAIGAFLGGSEPV
jgi:3-oxoadipate enol-lactonase